MNCLLAWCVNISYTSIWLHLLLVFYHFPNEFFATNAAMIAALLLTARQCLLKQMQILDFEMRILIVVGWHGFMPLKGGTSNPIKPMPCFVYIILWCFLQKAKVKCVLLGPPGVGKTALVAQYCDQAFVTSYVLLGLGVRCQESGYVKKEINLP